MYKRCFLKEVKRDEELMDLDIDFVRGWGFDGWWLLGVLFCFPVLLAPLTIQDFAGVLRVARGRCGDLRGLLLRTIELDVHILTFYF